MIHITSALLYTFIVYVRVNVYRFRIWLLYVCYFSIRLPLEYISYEYTLIKHILSWYAYTIEYIPLSYTLASAWRTYTERVHIKRILYEYTIKGGRAGGGASARIYKTINKEWWWLMIECKMVTSRLQGD